MKNIEILNDISAMTDVSFKLALQDYNVYANVEKIDSSRTGRFCKLYVFVKAHNSSRKKIN